MIRKIPPLLCLIIFSLLVGKGVYFLKKGFSPRRIHALNHFVHEDWDAETNEALNQTFHYLGRGRQCFAFASTDGKYVLKFPRTDIYKTPFWVQVLGTSSYRKKLEQGHQIREEFILNSFHISSNELKNQTALLATHLGKSQPSKRVLTLKDALGCTHRLALHNTSFVLQYKRPLLMKEFAKARKNGDNALAQKILSSILATIAERAKMGILNRDRSFLRNYGYKDGTAYQIDIGSFFKDPSLSKSQAYEKSLRDSSDPIKEWLSENDPDMLPHLEANLNKLL